jgi:hypothetical protein
MTTLEETFEQFKQLPDWEKYPMPEVFYDHFKIKKPKPSNSINDALTYTPPLSMPMNKNGKVEVREPAPGGVRDLPELPPLPVEVKKMNEEGELEDYPELKPTPFSEFYKMFNPNSTFIPPVELDKWLEKFKLQIGGDKKQGSLEMKLNPPTINNTTETQRE